MNSKKIIIAAAIFYYGLSDAQQSQYFSDRENYRYGLAENLYQNKIYNAAQFEYARQYFTTKRFLNPARRRRSSSTM